MTTQEQPTVGMAVDENNVATLPVGTVVVVRRIGSVITYTKTGDNNWSRRRGGEEPSDRTDAFAHSSRGNRYEVQSYPAITQAEALAAPLGTIIGWMQPDQAEIREVWTLRDQGWQRSDREGGEFYEPEYFVRSVGSFTEGGRFRWYWLHAPSAQPAVGSLLTVAQVQALPVGSVIRRADRGGGGLWERDTHTGRSGGVREWRRTDAPDAADAGHFQQLAQATLVSLPSDEPDAQLAEAMQRVRDCIDAVVRDQGQWGEVRDASFRKLGIPCEGLIPTIVVGQTISSDLINALPVGTVLRSTSNDNTWLVHVVTEPRTTTLVATTRERYRAYIGQSLGFDSDPLVLYLGEQQEFQEVSYPSAHEFMQAFYDEVEAMQTRHSWCNAVHLALERCGLDRDCYRQAPEALSVGMQLDAYRQGAFFATLDALPVGSVFQGDINGRNYVKSRTGFFSADDMSRIDTDDWHGEYTVRHIPAAPVSNEPF